MCGIVGYIGKKQAVFPLLEGIKKLEYRGYDSSGIAVLEKKGKISIIKKVGKISALESEVLVDPPKGTLGIAHTRWATHGKPSDANAHPHKGGKIALVHNGIIENFRELKRELEKKGRKFLSETDTEIIAHLLDEAFKEKKDPFEALSLAFSKLKGAFALAIIHEDLPGILMGVRMESPLVVGVGEDEFFLASDIPGCLNYTNRFIFLEDGDAVILDGKRIEIFNLREGSRVKRKIKTIDWSPMMAEKMGFKHFMEKEIFEQPRTVKETIMGRVDGNNLPCLTEEVDIPEDIRKIFIVACGTSYHAGLVGKYWIERLSRLPVEVDIASEFRYRDPIIGEGDLFIPVSQSGETADTLVATRLARERGAFVLSICNVMDSSIARASDSVIYTHAGPEIGVASTKAFTAQLSVLILIALQLSLMRKSVEEETIKELIEELKGIPRKLEIILSRANGIKELSERFYHYENFLYLGRGLNYPIALEGALKLKEISYIHAEGYPAGEMKHGPIALIDEKMPVFVISTKDPLLSKVLGNIEEVKSRGGKVISVCTDGLPPINSDHVVEVPEINPALSPIITVVPLQLFAYYVADLRGTDVDQPRNLAKSVTVE